jgi:hypothetical protein
MKATTRVDNASILIAVVQLAGSENALEIYVADLVFICHPEAKAVVQQISSLIDTCPVTMYLCFKSALNCTPNRLHEWSELSRGQAVLGGASVSPT